jgi:hypothetical protein
MLAKYMTSIVRQISKGLDKPYVTADNGFSISIFLKIVHGLLLALRRWFGKLGCKPAMFSKQGWRNQVPQVIDIAI